MNSANDVWNSVLSLLGRDLTSTAVSTWFDECQVVDIKDNTFVIYTPTVFKKGIIESRFKGAIVSALKEIFASEFEILILCEDELAAYNKSKDDSSPVFNFNDFTFERFVVGSSNKFAHAAAMAVADNPAQSYNPLFIYGDSGLGKTHLLYAIGNVVKRNHPDYRIIYIKGDDFTNELINALQVGKTAEFREKYRNANLLLVDDIQFIAGKTSTQEEFFHTFNTLYESKRQIVLTSDRPPKDMMRLEDRLKTRFEWGLLADIQPPDYETRVAIIRNKALSLGLILPDDVTAYIAENMTSNVRQLEGCVNKILAYKGLIGGTIDVPSVTKIIRDMFKEKTEYIPTPDDIIEETAAYYSLSADDLKGTRRTRNTALARQISMYLIRQLTTLSLTDIGDIYEGRDHSTVLTSIRKIENMVKESPDFSHTIRDITANINARK